MVVATTVFASYIVKSHVRFPPFCRAGRSVDELIQVLSANVKAEGRQPDKRAASV